MKRKINIALALALTLLLLSGCATVQPYNYDEYKRSDPKSILILPPKNESPEVGATYSLYSHTQRPLAEAGYYVLPISLVDETFKSNGLSVVDEIHLVETKKLYEIFGADAGLYINIKNYGTQYFVINSASIVTAEARLVDLKTGAVIWQGSATASSAEGESNQGGLAALLIAAVVKQIIGTVADQSHQIARITSNRLLSPAVPNGILYGPRSPLYKNK